MSTQQEQATAILAAINSRFPAVRAYEFDAGATANADHILIAVSRRYVAERLTSGEVSVHGGRLLTRYNATRVDNARELRRRTQLALEDVILPGDIGPFSFESEEPIGDDGEGWFSGADVWTF